MSELNEPRPCLGSIMLYYRCWLGMATGLHSIIHFLVTLCSNNIDIYIYIYPLYIIIHYIMSNFSPKSSGKKKKKDVSPSATSRADARDGQVVRPAEVAWHRVALDFGIFRVSLKIGDTRIPINYDTFIGKIMKMIINHQI